MRRIFGGRRPSTRIVESLGVDAVARQMAQDAQGDATSALAQVQTRLAPDGSGAQLSGVVKPGDIADVLREGEGDGAEIAAAIDAELGVVDWRSGGGPLLVSGGSATHAEMVADQALIDEGLLWAVHADETRIDANGNPRATAYLRTASGFQFQRYLDGQPGANITIFVEEKIDLTTSATTALATLPANTNVFSIVVLVTTATDAPVEIEILDDDGEPISFLNMPDYEPTMPDGTELNSSGQLSPFRSVDGGALSVRVTVGDPAPTVGEANASIVYVPL